MTEDNTPEQNTNNNQSGNNNQKQSKDPKQAALNALKEEEAKELAKKVKEQMGKAYKAFQVFNNEITVLEDITGESTDKKDIFEQFVKMLGNKAA